MDAVVRDSWAAPRNPKITEMLRNILAVPCGADVAYRALREAEAPMTAAAAPVPATTTRPPAPQSGKGHPTAPASNAAKVTQRFVGGGGTKGAKTPAAATAVPKTPPAVAKVPNKPPAASAKAGKTPVAAANLARGAMKIVKKDTKL